MPVNIPVCHVTAGGASPDRARMSGKTGKTALYASALANNAPMSNTTAGRVARSSMAGCAELTF